MKLKLLVAEKLNAFRALSRIVDSVEFQECLTLKPDDPYIRNYITNGDVDAVKKWVQRNLKAQVSEYSARQMRVLAAGLGIPRYCSMKKHVLLSEILRRQRAAKIAQITELVPVDQTVPNEFLD